LAVCSELAAVFGSELHLLYVVPTLKDLTPQEVPGGRLVPRTTRFLLDLETEQTVKLMKQQLESLLTYGIKASGSVKRGDPASEVIKAAAGKQADVFAMAASGLAGLGALWAKDLVLRISEDFSGALLLFPEIEK
jgi:nucleotide-binding universal stress UspA family protein